MGGSTAAPTAGAKLAVEGLSLTRSAATADGGRSEREVLRDVSFSVGEGEVFGVIGPSGAGKTTFLRLLNGLDTADRGSITLDDEIHIDEFALEQQVADRTSDEMDRRLACGGDPHDSQEQRGGRIGYRR